MWLEAGDQRELHGEILCFGLDRRTKERVEVEI